MTVEWETQSPRERELRGRGNERMELPMHDDSTVKLCECGCGQPAPIATITSKAKGWVAGQPKRFVHRHAKRRVTGEGPNPSGYCMCGCGLPAPIATKTKSYQGHIKGKPMRFVHGHNTRKGLTLASNGYLQTMEIPAGYEAMARKSDRRVLYHRLVAAQGRGRPLTEDEHVHHKNGDILDNRVENLQVLTAEEHARLHHELWPIRERRKGVVPR